MIRGKWGPLDEPMSFVLERYEPTGCGCLFTPSKRGDTGGWTGNLVCTSYQLYSLLNQAITQTDRFCHAQLVEQVNNTSRVRGFVPISPRTMLRGREMVSWYCLELWAKASNEQHVYIIAYIMAFIYNVFVIMANIWTVVVWLKVWRVKQNEGQRIIVVIIIWIWGWSRV